MDANAMDLAKKGVYRAGTPQPNARERRALRSALGIRMPRLAVLLAISTALSAASVFGQDLSQPHVPHQVLVRMAPGAAEGQRAALRNALLSRSSRSLGLVSGLERIETALDVPQALAVLANSPAVLYAEPDWIVRPASTVPNDTWLARQWGLHNVGQNIGGVPGVPDADIDMPEVWDTVTGNGETIVAVLDTGIQANHPDLVDNIWANEVEVNGVDGQDDDGNGYVDDKHGWDFLADDNDPDDLNGHGTSIAGTICAGGNNGKGVAGVMWSCRLMPLRFMDKGGSVSDAISALSYAVANGARVSNNSWGWPGGGNSQALIDAIAAAGAQGHIVVAAAGNRGVDNDTSPFYPASYSLGNVIAVAATDNQDQLAGFSSFGAASVDLGAPGLRIYSTYRGSIYAWSSGTSMATAHVTGVVALLQERNPGLTVAAVVDRVLSKVRPVQALSDVTVTGGVLNAFDALPAGAVAVCGGREATIVGTAANDFIVGTAAADVIHGLDGNDTIQGQAGDDTICGGSGDDIVYGNGGGNTLFGDAGNDRLTGGGGSDVLRGGTGDDQLFGRGGATDRLFGDGGDDRLFGEDGADHLDGGADFDLCDGGGASSDTAAGCEQTTAIP
jgi:subtilisin family serine protease